MTCEEVRKDFGVALAAEDDAIPLEFGAELAIVIDLAVEADDDLAGRIGHRLGSVGRKVENGEAHVRQTGLGIMPLSAAVRATVALGAVHPSEQVRLEAADISCDSAHGQAWPPLSA